ncbi:unnamed protein product [Paramecium sonneborni]|uniref:Uncharacterized protein n=1 Tax=Paramecium sonneborni TaxID=65129 RepID=A0A8S1PE44_9CILI|nr:unnamed protein product [Paramecium sonneborni]
MFNCKLLLFYPLYVTNDQESNISKTKLFINSIFEHLIHQIKFIWIYKLKSEKKNKFQYRQEDQKEPQFIDDSKGDLIAVLNNDIKNNYNYTIQAIKENLSYQIKYIVNKSIYSLINITQYSQGLSLLLFQSQYYYISFICCWQRFTSKYYPRKQYNIIYHTMIQFFHVELNFRKYFERGSQFLYKFQAHNHFPGMEVLFLKPSPQQILQITETLQNAEIVLSNIKHQIKWNILLKIILNDKSNNKLMNQILSEQNIRQAKMLEF